MKLDLGAKQPHRLGLVAGIFPRGLLFGLNNAVERRLQFSAVVRFSLEVTRVVRPDTLYGAVQQIQIPERVEQ